MYKTYDGVEIRVGMKVYAHLSDCSAMEILIEKESDMVYYGDHYFLFSSPKEVYKHHLEKIKTKLRLMEEQIKSMEKLKNKISYIEKEIAKF